MRIVVVGLGYVGLPLAVHLAKHFETWGLDISAARIAELQSGHDRTAEVAGAELSASGLNFVNDPAACPPADLYIVTVPTPIDCENRPDLGPLRAATRTVGCMLDRSTRPVVVFESTVYPGVTEDICRPILAEASGLTPSVDFFVGYSPERINPGDREHTVDRITKVIAGESDDVTERMADVYGRVTSGGVFRAASIKAAEAAKVIENAQRDINIAFINEITQIFSSLGLTIWDVLAAARTKWNFLPFEPGLVGGHCIGVDPYYLSYRAQELGHKAQVILAGRSINDGMANWIADQVHTNRSGRPGSVLVLGLTFKEDVPDLRNSKVADLIARLVKLGHEVTVTDPLADADEALHEYGIVLDAGALGRRYDCVIAAVPHASYKGMEGSAVDALVAEGGLVADLKGSWPAMRTAASPLSPGKSYWCL
ncbi:nucleotide sugar dehydrogenase [Brevundimonas sp.]|uniref:nucleotide sugar dehydrogenase n=1 Tax=Brevundimonas sp. TaxID=1871086 RepID=UPI0026382E5E|nr:nucleotide sugar dehydrogenase [Brevundimonas sp.]